MGTGWRRAFCTTIPRGDREAMEAERQGEIPENANPGPVRSCVKLGIFSSTSNPSTPRFNSQPVAVDDVPELPQLEDNTPKLRCKTSRRKMKSTPSSPRSPFNILKTALRISKSGCGVCLQSVKTGQGMAIYTAECSHSFHFPCITQLVRKQGIMVCPVCSSTWNDVPLLSPHKKTHPFPPQNDVVEKTITTTATTTTNSTGIFQGDKNIQSSISAVKTKPLDDAGMPYNDDEPLRSPTAGAKFNPIPEAEDEDDEDAEEFQGFFVNSSPSTPTKKTPTAASVHCRRNQRSMEVKLLPEAAVVSVGRSHETFTVALRVKAPPPPLISADGGATSPALLSPSHRAPVDLVTVLDVSGSMTDAKLQMLKRAVRLVISSLGSSDRLSVIAFSSSPQRLLPLRRMTQQGQRLARRIIDHLAVSPGKSVGPAMNIAAKVLKDRREKNPVASIILLSDGQDQSSSQTGTRNQRHPNVHVSSSRFWHVEIPVSSFSCSQDAVANAFTKRVGGLLSVVVQDLRLQLGFSSGSAPGEISAVYSCNGRPSLLKPDSIRLGDLYAEEERELLVELRVPTSAIGSHHVLSVRCSYMDPGTGEVMHARERALLVPRPHAVRSSDPRIERLRNLFLATRAVAETSRLVERGELVGAQHLLVSARMVVAESSSASTEEYVRWLEAELAALQWRKQYNKVRQHQQVGKVDQQQRRRMGEQQVAFVDENGEPLTPTSAWRAAEQLAKVAMMKKALNRASDLHGFENARF